MSQKKNPQSLASRTKIPANPNSFTISTFSGQNPKNHKNDEHLKNSMSNFFLPVTNFRLNHQPTTQNPKQQQQHRIRNNNNNTESETELKSKGKEEEVNRNFPDYLCLFFLRSEARGNHFRVCPKFVQKCRIT